MLFEIHVFDISIGLIMLCTTFSKYEQISAYIGMLHVTCKCFLVQCLCRIKPPK